MDEADFKMSLAAKTLCATVRFYQLTLSWMAAGSCRLTPNCSAYAIKALEHHGAMHGSWLIVRRLLRCHPWSGAGYDPVPDRLDLGNSGDA